MTVIFHSLNFHELFKIINSHLHSSLVLPCSQTQELHSEWRSCGVKSVAMKYIFILCFMYFTACWVHFQRYCAWPLQLFRSQSGILWWLMLTIVVIPAYLQVRRDIQNQCLSPANTYFFGNYLFLRPKAC